VRGCRRVGVGLRRGVVGKMREEFENSGLSGGSRAGDGERDAGRERDGKRDLGSLRRSSDVGSELEAGVLWMSVL